MGSAPSQAPDITVTFVESTGGQLVFKDFPGLTMRTTDSTEGNNKIPPHKKIRRKSKSNENFMLLRPPKWSSVKTRRCSSVCSSLPLKQMRIIDNAKTQQRIKERRTSTSTKEVAGKKEAKCAFFG